MGKTLSVFFLSMIFLSSSSEDEGWTDLLDKDLSKWENYLSYRHTIDYNGKIPKDKSGAEIKPVGYNKNESKVFTVIQEEGKPVLRISGEIYGCVYTKEEFENYHLRLKVKWGTRKDVPRKGKLRDSGLLYHSIGEAGVDYWRAWMLSQEFQIMEGHIGDYWNIATSAADIRAFLPEGKMNSIASQNQPFLPFGTGAPEGFCLRSENHESTPGEWTTIELITMGDKSLHIVNSHVVMVLQRSRYVQHEKEIPLTKGRIQLQSEAAEVFFKEIQIRPLKAMPDQYKHLF